jgi:hypothetical protein
MPLISSINEFELVGSFVDEKHKIITNNTNMINSIILVLNIYEQGSAVLLIKKRDLYNLMTLLPAFYR